MVRLKKTADGFILDIYVQPKASRNKIYGEFNNALKICITSPPVDGAANKACIKFLSNSLGLNQSQVRILCGEHSRKKQVLVTGITLKELKQHLKID